MTLRGAPLLIALATVPAGCGDDTVIHDGDAAPPADASRDTGPLADAGADGGPGDAGAATCGTGSAEALMACVERDRYVSDLTAIALPRQPGTEQWQTVQDLCADRFSALGFEVELHDYGTGVNVVGRLAGAEPGAGDVIISAHYDSTPDCPGADDNATGVAGALESARVLSTGSYRRSLVVACWDEEERGLIGSGAYAARASRDGQVIHNVFVYEMIGYRSDEPGSQSVPTGLDIAFPAQYAQLERNELRGDFIAAVGDRTGSGQAMRDMLELSTLVGLSVIRLDLGDALLPEAGDLRRSDHASFWDEGYPGIMLSDTANFRNERYHCTGGPDIVDVLDHDFATQVVQVTVGAAARALEVQ